MKKTKRIVALLLALCMTFGMIGNVSFANAETPEWFGDATAISSFANVETEVKAGEAAYYKYTAQEEAFLDFGNAVSENKCTVKIAVYDASGKAIINATSFSYAKTIKLAAEAVYYFEVYSETYDEDYNRVKAEDKITWSAVIVKPQVITEIGTVTTATTADASVILKYVPQEDVILDFCSGVCTDKDAKANVALYDADFKTISTESTFTYAKSAMLEKDKVYYIELYAQKYDSVARAYVKIADQVEWTVVCEAPTEITTLDNEITTEITVNGGAKFYKYEVSKDGFLDFRAAVSEKSTEEAVFTPQVYLWKVEDGVMGYVDYGTFDEVGTCYVKDGEVYFFEIYSYNDNNERVADTVKWSAAVIEPTVLVTLPSDTNKAEAILPVNGSAIYKYTSTVDGYFELTAGETTTNSLAKFYIYDAEGYELDGGTWESVKKIAVKPGDVLYIEVYNYEGLADTVKWAAKAYESGTVNSPEVFEINNFGEFVSELYLNPANGGRYYTHTVAEEGQYIFYLPEYMVGDEIVFNCDIEVTYGGETYTLSKSKDVYSYVNDRTGMNFKYPAIMIDAKAGDVFNVRVFAKEEATTTFAVLYTSPLGTFGNPERIEDSDEITVAPGEKYYFAVDRSKEVIITGEGKFGVAGYDMYEEMYGTEKEAVGSIAVTGYDVYYISNMTDKEVTYKLVASYPLGSYDNPAQFDCYNQVTFNFEAYVQTTYYFEFTATKDLTLYFQMPEIEASPSGEAGWLIGGYIYNEGDEYVSSVELHPWLADTTEFKIELKKGQTLYGEVYAITNVESQFYPMREAAGSLEFTVATITENPFTDVSENDYFATPVLWASANDITSGKKADKFAPNDKCTRAQVVTFIWRAMGRPTPTTTENPFTDVAEGEYYYEAVLWAYENGIASGKKADKFAPEDTCTRAQVVTFLWRAMGRPTPATTENPFTDVAEGEYYYEAVLWAYENGIASGKSADRFAPTDTCKRSHVVTFLYYTYK